MIELKNTQQQKKFKILLIGDHCIDIYQYGTVDRISPEAPVPVFKFHHEEQKLGMAANVKNNLEALGCDVQYLFNSTSVKTRLIDKRSNQHIVRIDNDELSDSVQLNLNELKYYDAVVFSDYNKGSVSYELVQNTRQSFDGPIFIDTKKQYLDRFNGCFVKINEVEYENLHTSNGNLIVTLGSKGAMIVSSTQEKYFDPVRTEVVDVTGAGDTFLSALTYQYLNTKNLDDSVRFAIRASSVTVKHMGVYAPTLEEICD
jgi:bifunctional ADP-heptose synthase (sugar kinase/adenylyltransferase)